MPTITTPPASGGRRVAVAVTGGAIALLALIAVAAVATPAGDRSVAAGAAPTTPSVSAAPTTTERAPTPTSTSTVLAALDADQEFTTWFGSLSPDRQLAFRLLTGTDDERAAFIRLLTPVPAPPPPPPPPAPVVAPAKPRAPSCATWATQEEANAWFAANAAAHDVSVIDSNGDGVPCTTHFAPPPPPAPPAAPAVEPTAATGAPTGPPNAFLACVMRRESGGNYQAVNRSSGAGGAYQFLQSTWNNTVRHAGRPDLVGLHPSQASPADQDAMALHLYQWQGRSPWAGPGC